MPYQTRKVKNRNCYKVINTETRKVYSKCSSKKNVEKQLRLLRAIEYNPKFRYRNMKTRKNRK